MSNGKSQSGQQYRSDYNILIEFVEQMLDRKTANSDAGTSGMEITPNDSDSALSRQYAIAAINAAFATVIVGYDTFISLDLPDVLTGITGVFNSTSGNGANSMTGTGETGGTDYGTLSLSLHSSGQGSASIQPEIQYTISVTPKDNILAHVKVFFINGNSNIADVLTTLSSAAFFNATVLQIPLFAKQIDTISLLGQQASLSASADVQQRLEISRTEQSVTTGQGTGSSISFGTTNRSIQLPATIHAALACSGTDSVTAQASAAASMTASTDWQGLSQSKTEGPITVTGSIGPDVPATPVTAIPTSGLYLCKLDTTPFSGFGNNMVRAVVVDFTQFA